MFKRANKLKRRNVNVVLGVTAAFSAGVIALSTGSADAAARRATSAALNGVSVQTIAADSFSRTTDTGFGSADVGGDYTTDTQKGATLSVNGGQGVVSNLSLGGSANETLRSTSALNTQVQSTLIVPEVSSSRIGLYDALVLRRQANGDRYLAKTFIGANGKVILSTSYAPGGKADIKIGRAFVLPTAIKSGDAIITQARVVGTGPVALIERAWVKGQPVPGWQIVNVDTTSTAITKAGSVGFGSYLSLYGTPTSIRRDDFSAVTLTKKHAATPTTSTTVVKTTTTSTTTPPARTTSTIAPPVTTTSTTSTTVPVTPVSNGSSSFTIAVMPDTQQEVLKASDPRFLNRTNWLVANQKQLNLKFVTATGDVNNWDTPDHSQYVISSAAMVPLHNAGIPYSLANGNHDNEATGVGGSARDPKNTRTLLRDTSTWNSFFKTADYTDVTGQFEPNKSENIYSTFDAGGDHWMVLVLEFDPRVAVVDWAKTVVASHPNYNVILVTHSYLNADSSISNNAEYGDTSGQYLFDNLVKPNANVKMVFSGHVGIAGSRTDTDAAGNKVASMLQTYHSNTTNPVRLVQIDTKAGTVHSYVYAPYTNETLSSGAADFSGMTWVRP